MGQHGSGKHRDGTPAALHKAIGVDSQYSFSWVYGKGKERWNGPG